MKRATTLFKESSAKEKSSLPYFWRLCYWQWQYIEGIHLLSLLGCLLSEVVDWQQILHLIEYKHMLNQLIDILLDIAVSEYLSTYWSKCLGGLLDLANVEQATCTHSMSLEGRTHQLQGRVSTSQLKKKKGKMKLSIFEMKHSILSTLWQKSKWIN